MRTFDAGQRTHFIVNKLIEETTREHPRTVRCKQCGKPVAVNDSIRGLCGECYNALQAAKDQAKA